jgi:pyridoxal phosphate enzyme (YggS family)
MCYHAAMNSTIPQHLGQVRRQLEDACVASHRSPSDVTLVAVSKRHPVTAIETAYQAGQIDFGENYAQEFAAKRQELDSQCPDIRLHYIGHLQSNKARLVAGHATLVHTVDRPKILTILSRLCQDIGATQEFLFEVHLSPEESKAGCLPDQLPALLELALTLPNLRPRGLMTMPPWDLDAEAARPYFSQLRELKDRMAAQFSLAHFDQLSMGMSHDFPVAIAEGATLVRVGTAIFGDRA